MKTCLIRKKDGTTVKAVVGSTNLHDAWVDCVPERITGDEGEEIPSVENAGRIIIPWTSIDCVIELS